MSLFSNLFGNPEATPLDSAVHEWLETRKALKAAKERTFEALLAEAYPSELAKFDEVEDKLERKLTKLEIAIDGMLV